jgi:hypothetical protein
MKSYASRTRTAKTAATIAQRVRHKSCRPLVSATEGRISSRNSSPCLRRGKANRDAHRQMFGRLQRRMIAASRKKRASLSTRLIATRSNAVRSRSTKRKSWQCDQQRETRLRAYRRPRSDASQSVAQRDSPCRETEEPGCQQKSLRLLRFADSVDVYEH